MTFELAKEPAFTEALAERIRTFWAAQGHAVRLETVKQACASPGKVTSDPVHGIRSDMRNGKPVTMRFIVRRPPAPEPVPPHERGMAAARLRRRRIVEIMHDSDAPWGARGIAVAIGSPVSVVIQQLDEMERAGEVVASVDRMSLHKTWRLAKG